MTDTNNLVEAVGQVLKDQRKATETALESQSEKLRSLAEILAHLPEQFESFTGDQVKAAFDELKELVDTYPEEIQRRVDEAIDAVESLAGLEIKKVRIDATAEVAAVRRKVEELKIPEDHSEKIATLIGQILDINHAINAWEFPDLDPLESDITVLREGISTLEGGIKGLQDSLAATEGKTKSLIAKSQQATAEGLQDSLSEIHKRFEALSGLPDAITAAEDRTKGLVTESQQRAAEELSGLRKRVQELEEDDGDKGLLESLQDRIKELEALPATLTAAKAHTKGLVIDAELRAAEGLSEVQRQLDEVQLLPGAEGAPGKDGSDGVDGAGIDTKAWAPGIYREGSIVQYESGKYARAKCDTNTNPRNRKDWDRFGYGGFGFQGVKSKTAEYEDGDIYIDGGSCFIWRGDKGRMLVQRGAPGKQGSRGLPGKDGKAGEPAAKPLEVRPIDNGLAVVFEDGNILELSSEFFGHYFEVHGKKAFASFLTEEQQKLEEEGPPITRFLGAFSNDRDYAKGDVVLAGMSTWLCTEPVTNGIGFAHDHWSRIAGGGGGGGGLAASNVASPFNVVNLSLAIPRTGAGNGDTYFSLDDHLLRIWDDTNKQWVIPGAVISTRATDAQAQTGVGILGEMRWSLATDTMWVWEGSQWTKASSGVTHVADAAARIAYTSGYVGELVVQEDDGSLWHWMSPPGGGAAQWIPVMPRPADNAILRSLVWDPADPNIVHWRDERDALLTVVDNAAMFAIPQTHLQTGKLVYNQTAGKLYEFIAAPATLTRSIADWKEAGGSSGGISVYNRAADLPQLAASGTPIPPYTMAFVRFRADATTPLDKVFIATPAAVPPAVQWIQVGAAVSAKALKGGTDPADGQPDDLRVTTESGHKEIKYFDNATNAWVVIYSEDDIKAAIAAGNLFTGTVQEAGHGTAGAIDLTALGAETSLGAGDKGHYWVFVGTAGYQITANELGGAASQIDGQVLNVGDWIQVSEPTTGNYQYSVIPGDLLSKATADSLFGMNTWAQGAYQIGTLISYNGSLYKASVAILATDLAPDDATNTKWVKIPISAGVHNVPADNNLPTTAPSGDVYLVVNSARANGGPAFFTYDTPSSQWLMIAGGSTGVGGGTPLNLNGGELLYNVGTPIGSITMWPTNVPPDGWLVCNGNAFDGVRYPILMQLLGGNNHTPDLQGQFIRGATGTLDNYAKHQWKTGLPRSPLTVSNSGNHQHDYWDTLDSSGQGIHHAARAPGESYIAPSQKPTWPDGDHSHTISGGDAETAPDHVILNFIIKAEDQGLGRRII